MPDPAQRPLDPPTVGERHPHTRYDDPRRFWRKIRYLACDILWADDATQDDAYALFGNMNLDAGRSGWASAVRIDPSFARWILATIRDRLRPRFLVCLGLVSMAEAGTLLAEAFDGFNPRRPHCEHPFHADGRVWKFREWDTVGPAGNAMKIVYCHSTRVVHRSATSGTGHVPAGNSRTGTGASSGHSRALTNSSCRSTTNEPQLSPRWLRPGSMFLSD